MIAIIHRELVATLRSWRALALQLAFFLCLGGMVVLRWPSDAHVDVEGTISRQILRVFGYGMMIGLMLVSPAFPATSIVRERVQGTLALLLNAPITAPALVAGKLIGTLAFILLLIALSLPAAAACFSLGGVSLVDQLGAMYLVLVLLAIEYVCLGLFVSSLARSADSALRITYAAILLLAIASLAPFRFVSGATWASPTLISLADWFRCLSPIPAMAEVLGDAAVGSGGLNAASGAFAKFCIASAALSILFFAGAVHRVSTRPLDRARSAGRMTDDRTAKAQVLRRIMYLWFFDPQRRSGPIAPWQNPVMVKEQRCRRFGRSNWMMRLIGAYLILSLLLVLAATTMSNAQGVTTMLGGIAIMQVSLILLFTPSLAGGLLSGERESRGWQLLQMTPMSSSTIIAGKLLSAALPLALVLLATLPAFGVLVLFDPSLWRMALAVLTTLALFAVLAIVLSAGVGSLFRHTAPATATAYTLLVALSVGTLIFWLGQDAPFGRSFVEAVLLANPLAATLNLIGTPGFTQYTLVPGNWYVVIALSCVGLLLLISQTRRLSRPR